MELSAGKLVSPSVRLARLLRRGGMGEVWVADHLTLRTQVVVKFMSHAFAENAQNLARFRREAEAAAQVKSPHVVQTLDFGVTDDGLPYIVLELLEGVDLGQRIKSRLLSLEELAHAVEGTARALTKAHERGIVHRDIKPSNLFVCDAGGGVPFVKVVDFGIAKGMDDENPVTVTGDVVGTPAYMSPEQLDGRRSLDHRTDLWSLGVCAFKSVTGSPVFRGDTIAELAVAVLTAPIPRPSSIRPDLPAAFDEWFLRACCRDPKGRFQSAREMADALWTVVHPDGLRAIPPPFPSNNSGLQSGEVPAFVEATGAASAKTRSTTRRPPPATSTALLVLVGVMVFVTAVAGAFAIRWGSRPPSVLKPAVTAVAAAAARVPRPEPPAAASVSTPAPEASPAASPASASRRATEPKPVVPSGASSSRGRGTPGKGQDPNDLGF